MSLKEACVEAKGVKEQIPAELIDMGLKGQAAITKWVRPLHQLCSLKASNIWACFDYSAYRAVVSKSKDFLLIVVPQVQDPSMNDALLNELLHWNDEVNAVVSDFNLG